MQIQEQSVNGRTFSITDVVPMTWGEGAILPPDITPEDQHILDGVFLESIVPVTSLAASGCTDGRVRLGTEAQVPVLQKTVGADIMELFAAA